jgi:hypothetical protein
MSYLTSDKSAPFSVRTCFAIRTRSSTEKDRKHCIHNSILDMKFVHALLHEVNVIDNSRIFKIKIIHLHIETE